MHQGTLFDFDPPAPSPAVVAKRLARASGPETSKAAAREVAVVLNEMQSWALAHVMNCQGGTASEICEEAGVGDIRKINRRLPELEEKGLVVRGPARVCKVTGKSAATWSPKERVR